MDLNSVRFCKWVQESNGVPKAAEEVDEGEIRVKLVARAPGWGGASCNLGGVSNSSAGSMLETEICGRIALSVLIKPSVWLGYEPRDEVEDKTVGEVAKKQAKTCTIIHMWKSR